MIVDTSFILDVIDDVDAAVTKEQELEAVLNSLPLVDMTPSISRRAGRLLGERLADASEDDGPGIGKGDAAIAATAIERDEPVLAGDSHFRNIPGVTHETYR